MTQCTQSINDASTVISQGTLSVTGASQAVIRRQGASTGQNVLINRGVIAGSGDNTDGIFNSAPAVTMLNDTGAVISTNGANGPAMYDYGGLGGGTLTNNGRLSTSGDSAVGMYSSTNNDTLVNNGTITTTRASANGMLAAGSTGGNVVTNNGTINVSGTGSSGIQSSDASPGLITNTGTITASGPTGVGVYIAGKVTFNNDAGASIVSKQANGVDGNGGGTYNNAGTISAQAFTLSFANAPVPPRSSTPPIPPQTRRPDGIIRLEVVTAVFVGHVAHANVLQSKQRDAALRVRWKRARTAQSDLSIHASLWTPAYYCLFI